MLNDLSVVVTGDPSHGFQRLPSETPEYDLRVSFDVHGGGKIRARMQGAAIPQLATGEHRVDLDVDPETLRKSAMRLRQLWKTTFVDYQPLNSGRPVANRILPCASKANLSAEPEEDLRRLVGQLADRGAYLLFNVLLRGNSRPLSHFREFLVTALAQEHLRIRFDSTDLYLPWPMLCLKPEHLPVGPDGSADKPLDDLFRRFLGYRHEIEHAGEPYVELPSPCNVPGMPAASLNHNGVIGSELDAVAAVADFLRTNTRYTVRESFEQLWEFFKTPIPDEQLMYFWCHGKLGSDSDGAHLVFELSDGQPFDGETVDAARADLREDDRISPFILFNACYAGLVGPDEDSSYMSRVLIRHGAQGVLGPQIEMPQAFAAEYALHFLKRYIPGGAGASAGRTALDLSRYFADEYRSPLGIAYGLHGGMNTFISTGTATSAGISRTDQITAGGGDIAGAIC